jgi:glycosyltransferase involved in cell wall biosynthesis
MRVAYVCSDPGVPVLGRKGASVHAQAILRVLVERGAEVHLVAVRTGGPLPVGLERVRVHGLPPVGGPAAERERAAQSADAAAARVLDDIGELDLVYERYSLWGRTATAWAGAAGIPVVLEVNAPLVQEQAAHRVLVDRDAAEDVAVAALSAATVVACVSPSVAAWARGRSSRPGRVHVLPNGVDVSRVRPGSRAVVSAAAAPFTIGFVGTLKPWHGVATLMDALALLDARSPGEYRVLLVGDGPEAGALRRQADLAGITYLVEHAGAVDPVAVHQMLHRMDVAVAPYPRLEDFYFSPLKIYEYLAAGLPVVASAVGNLPGLLQHGALGSLVEPGRADELAAAIAGLRADPVRRAQLRAAGRAAAVQFHTWDGVVDRVLTLVGGLPGTYARTPVPA